MTTPELKQKCASNIKKLVLLNFFYFFIFIAPVLIPFFQQFKLDLKDIYLLQIILFATIIVLEVPSGYLSDLLGRKNVLIISAVFHGCAYMGLIFFSSFAGFAFFEVLSGISISFMSGTDLSLLYDSQQQLEQSEENLSKVLGRMGSAALFSETIAALVGGMVAMLSLFHSVVLNAVFAWFPLFIILGLYEVPRAKLNKKEHLINLKKIIEILFLDAKIVRLILVNLVFFASATIIPYWSLQALWGDKGVPISAFGALWAAYSITMAVVSRYAYLFERYLKAYIFILIGVLPIVSVIGLTLNSLALVIVLGLCFQVSRGLNSVITWKKLNHYVSSEMRATVNSIASLGVRLPFLIFGPIFGWLIDARGFQFAYLFLGGVYALLLLSLTVPLILQLKKESSIKGT